MKHSTIIYTFGGPSGSHLIGEHLVVATGGVNILRELSIKCSM